MRFNPGCACCCKCFPCPERCYTGQLCIRWETEGDVLCEYPAFSKPITLTHSGTAGGGWSGSTTMSYFGVAYTIQAGVSCNGTGTGSPIGGSDNYFYAEDEFGGYKVVWLPEVSVTEWTECDPLELFIPVSNLIYQPGGGFWDKKCPSDPSLAIIGIRITEGPCPKYMCLDGVCVEDPGGTYDEPTCGGECEE